MPGQNLDPENFTQSIAERAESVLCYTFNPPQIAAFFDYIQDPGRSKYDRKRFSISAAKHALRHLVVEIVLHGARA